jgi:alkylhydroperoxidase/carboxymuconolactone decarboxylase family protein YurZ
MPLPTPPDVTTILSRSDLETIQNQYDRIEMGQVLSSILTHEYPPIADYLTGIGTTIYPEMQKGGKPGTLLPANRERCLVALLACRSRRLELAIHLYMALANGVGVAELAHIVVATGAYTGVDTVGNAFTVMEITLGVLKAMVAANTANPEAVFGALLVPLPG